MTEIGFSGSYRADDVTFLLKPVTMAPVDVADKERLIQSGQRHYSEMLSAETAPGADYLALYDAALARNGARLADDIAALAKALDARAAAGRPVVLVSLARAGTPIGVLLRRALTRLGRDAPHYSVSIIRDRGIDHNAINTILACHAAQDVVFIDGWTGKGAIRGELDRSFAGHPHIIHPYLVVVADPAGKADLCASHDDYLIPSGLLNSVISGLISRSVLNADLVGHQDFHACVIQSHLAKADHSRAFVDHINAMAARSIAAPAKTDPSQRAKADAQCDAVLHAAMQRHGVSNPNLIKPGIAEATRVFLRRVPQVLLLRDGNDPDVAHLLHLAKQKNVPVELHSAIGRYRAMAVIQSLKSEQERPAT